MTLNYIKSLCFLFAHLCIPFGHKMVALSSLLWEDIHVSVVDRQFFCLHSPESCFGLEFRKVGLGNIWDQQVGHGKL